MNENLKAYLLATLMTLCGGAQAQQPAPKPDVPAAVERQDANLDIAAAYVGRALFLRCLCAENNLTFDPQGKPTGPLKPADWTLSAVDVSKVERKAPGSIELEGVRVAIRYNTDRHEFE